MRRAFHGFALAFVVAAGCSAARVDVDTDYDPEFDFTGRTQYAWLAEPKNSALAGTLEGQRLTKAVDDELARKGFRKVEPADAQLFVGRHFAAERALDIDTIDRHYGYARPARVWYHSAPMTETRVREYVRGTLLIDMADPASKRLVWRASAEGKLDEDSTPAEREKRIRAAVAEMLETFPPKAAAP